MEREFLQNFKVGEQPLPDAVIEAILNEHGKGIEREKAKYSDYETIKTQLDEAQKTIQGFQSQDIDGIKKAAADWEQKYNKAIADHQAEMAELAFGGVLKDAIAAKKGRNATAISALLDMDALKASKNQAADIDAALDALKKENGYLFEDDKTPPPFAPGAGTGPVNPQPAEGLNAIRAAAGLKNE